MYQNLSSKCLFQLMCDSDLTHKSFGVWLPTLTFLLSVWGEMVSKGQWPSEHRQDNFLSCINLLLLYEVTSGGDGSNNIPVMRSMNRGYGLWPVTNNLGVICSTQTANSRNESFCQFVLGARWASIGDSQPCWHFIYPAIQKQSVICVFSLRENAHFYYKVVYAEN